MQSFFVAVCVAILNVGVHFLPSRRKIFVPSVVAITDHHWLAYFQTLACGFSPVWLEMGTGSISENDRNPSVPELVISYAWPFVKPAWIGLAWSSVILVP